MYLLGFIKNEMSNHVSSSSSMVNQGKQTFQAVPLIRVCQTKRVGSKLIHEYYGQLLETTFHLLFLTDNKD